ncbi:MAG: hydroxymethylglutaryl-CoA synthase [Candidatus Micrarchaeota archaeon]
MAGIIGYGAFIPRFRIKVEEIARVWGKNAEQTSKGLGIKEKAVSAFDEDSATISVEASLNAINSFNIDAQRIQAIYVGSESKPYAVKPTATIVAEAIGASPELTAADLEFACKAGTAGIQACMGMVDSGMIDVGLAVGADTAQGRPNDALEFSAGSGGAAFLIGKDKIIANIEATYSVTTDTPDFWRRQHARYPTHTGRFTAEPGYFKHVSAALNGLLNKIEKKVNDFDFVVLHQPNGKFPLVLAKKVGIEKEKIMTGLLAPLIGNTYSGASMLGLAAVLDEAKAGDEILVVSYGSGAGSDAFALKATKELEKQRTIPSVKELIANKEYIDYSSYIKHMKKLKAVE